MSASEKDSLFNRENAAVRCQEHLNCRISASSVMNSLKNLL